jgi:hypothetical protein
MKEASSIFDQMLIQAKIVQDRGLHYGTTHDTELKKLEALESEHEKFFRRNEPIGRLFDLKGDLEGYLPRLDRSYLIYL